MIAVQIFAALLFLFGIGAGATLILLSERASGGSWLREVGPPLRLLARLTPAFGIAAVMAWALAGPQYPWWDDPQRFGWLGPTWATVRLVVMIGLTAVFAWTGHFARGWAAAGLILLAPGLSAVSFDWFLSLDPEMKSSIFGLVMLTGFAVSGMAAAVLAGLPAWDRAARQRWGSALLILLALWGYMEFMQYIVFWAGDLPWEARWWLERSETAWGVLYWGVVVFHLLVPAALLSYHFARQRPLVLAAAAVSILLGRALETALWIGPSLPGAEGWWVGLLAAVAAFALAWGSARLVRSRDRHRRHGRAADVRA